MESLRGVLQNAGLYQCQDICPERNVVFESTGYTPPELVKRIETQIEKTYGFTVAVFIRQADELQEILTGNPFL